MSETVDKNSGYPRKISIVIDGQEREAYDTNNLFGYISAILRVRERELAGLAPHGLIDEVMQHSDLRPYIEGFIDGEGELNQAVVQQAQISNGFRERLYAPDHSAEDDRAYGEWVKEIRDTDALKLMMSDALEAMAPAMEAAGRQPIELTI